MKPSPHTPARAFLYTAALLGRTRLSEKTFEIELTRPQSFDFMPGQRIRFVHGNMDRDYSLISAPADPVIALCVRHVERGAFSPVLKSAGIGSRFSFSGPHGYFTFRPSVRPPVFIATGTGIAPFVSMSRSGVAGFILLHGVRDASELYYNDFFQKMARLYVPCLSRARAGNEGIPHAFNGRVTDYLKAHFHQGEYDFYLCGRFEMIRDIIRLIDRLFPNSLVYTETFY